MRVGRASLSEHDKQVQSIIQVIEAIEERPEEPRRPIGFHASE